MLRYLIIILIIFNSTNTSQWFKTSGPYSLNPVSFLSVEAYGDIIFAGSYQFDIMYRSTDNGLSWEGNLEVDHINDIKIFDDVVYACTDQDVYRSTDFGETWIKSVQEFYNVFTIESTTDFLVVGTSQGVFKSVDGGSNWTPSSNGLPFPFGGGTVHDIKSYNNMLFAGTEDGVYKSTDGTNWNPVNTGLPIIFTGYHPRVTTVLVTDGYIFAGTQGQGVFRSSNFGSTWDSVNTGLPRAPYNPDIYDPVYSSISYESRIYLGLDVGLIYISTDNGQSWFEGANNLTSAYIFGFTAGSDALLAASKEGILKSTSVDSIWIPLFNKFPKIVSINSLASTPQNIIASGSSNYWNGFIGGTYFTANLGDSWCPVDSPSTDRKFNSFEFNNGLLWGGNWQGVFLSTDEGLSWNNVSPDSIYYVNSIIKSDNYLFAGWGFRSTYEEFGGVYRSTNEGISWTNTGLIGQPVISLGKINNLIYAGTLREIYHSSDNGDTWALANNGIPAKTRIHSFTSIGDNLFAGTHRGVFRSTDFGETWFSASNGLIIDTLDYIGISTIISYENFLLAGSGYGIYISDNLGDNWSDRNLGFPEDMPFIYSLIIHEGNLVAGTSDGVWRRPVSEITNIEPVQSVDLNYCLEQNYPNPFNPSTLIRYNLPVSGNVLLVIYDILGNEIVKLVDEYKPAGRYEVEFSAKGRSASNGNAYNLSSGVFFYRLKSGDFVEARKMLLLK